MSLDEHIESATRAALDGIPAGERSDIYVVSLFVYDEEDDPRRPTVTVGYNTEAAVRKATDETDEVEARWNFAFWRHNELALICDSEHDPAGAQLREAWVREQGLWFDDSEPFDERGEELTRRFIALLEGVVQRLHTADVERVFARRLPIIIHELEYYDEIANQNVRANPPGVVPDEFVRFCTEG